MGIISGYILGWLRYGIVMALIGSILSSISFGFTYPVVWAAISVLVDETVKGTAYGFATAIRFGGIAISYVIVGVLTKEEDSETKYINAQIYMVLLIVLSMMFYILLYIMDIKCNNSILKINESDKKLIKVSNDIDNNDKNNDSIIGESNISMKQIRV